ncbi:MAG: DUF2059 domain-containing protein [Beijerinckiaceae bacterium]|nr:DUF2059 domain-containing protein [Beijerinckiaceae bacterium]
MPGFAFRQRPTWMRAVAPLVLAACVLGARIVPACSQNPSAAEAKQQTIAQAGQPAAAGSQQDPPPQAAPEAAEPSAAHIQAARELILATGISRSFQIIIPEFMDQIDGTLTQTRPELTNDLLAVMGQLKPEFDKQADEMIDLSARIYARLLTEDEIRAILAFFKSDAGRKYVGAQPLFLNQLVAGMQAWQQKISVNMMTRVREEMKKKGHDL